ncbi:MAG TPA: hypothetical protein VG297_14555 [Bryobacteraceae bacterium]|jgi:hypothetical protein|nr:hypothetical protein [Bryobacteraceae bacterium]
MPGKKNIGLKQAGPDETFQWKLSPAEGGMLRSKATKEPIGNFVKLGMTGYIDYDIVIYTQDARSQDDVNRAILDAVKDQLGLKLDPRRTQSRCWSWSPPGRLRRISRKRPQ